MGVCASSGSVGFWPISSAALRSLLCSHAHIWHSFPDMITIHLPVWNGSVEYFHHSKWNCSDFPEPPPLFRFLPLLLLPRTPRVQPFPPLSQLFVSADVIGSLGRDVSSMTSRQRGVRECVREGLHLNSPKLIAHFPFFLSFIGSDMKEQNRCN